MTIKNADMPAMPTHDVFEDCGMDGNSGPHLTQTTSYGLTKREMMTMHILPALIEVYDVDLVATQGESVARDAVMYAGLMLAELERTK